MSTPLQFDKVLPLDTTNRELQRRLDIAFDKISVFSDFTRYTVLTNTSTQSIPNNTLTKIVFDKVVKDPSSMYDINTPSRITCKIAGLYTITTNFSYTAGVGNLRIASIVLNGTIRLGQDRRLNYSSLDSFVGVNIIYYLEVNDYIEIFGLQDSGGALNVNTSATPDSAPTFAVASLAS